MTLPFMNSIARGEEINFYIVSMQIVCMRERHTPASMSLISNILLCRTHFMNCDPDRYSGSKGLPYKEQKVNIFHSSSSTIAARGVERERDREYTACVSALVITKLTSFLYFVGRNIKGHRHIRRRRERSVLMNGCISGYTAAVATSCV